jgi:trehalose-phosphatase
MRRNIKLKNVETLILVLKETEIRGALLREWMDLVPEVIVIHHEAWKQPEDFTDPEIIRDTHILREEGIIQLRRILQGIQVNSYHSVYVTDLPLYMKAVRSQRWAMKIGLSQALGKAKPFYDMGADLVQACPEEIIFTKGVSDQPTFTQALPNIFSRIQKFHLPFKHKKTVYFFDYDGTLSHIVSDPSKAAIDQRMRNLLFQLSDQHQLAIVSGRDLNDLMNFIRLDNLIYAGSHGFRIKGPYGLNMENKKAVELLPKLNEMEKKLRQSLESYFEGVEVERKLFAIAIHYRNARHGSVKKIKHQVKELTRTNPDFKTGSGKKIIEVKPSIEWHKGKAIEWILDSLGHPLGDTEVVPVYVGDDVTDEDAFRTLSDDGFGILVGSHHVPSAAHYRLEDVSQVAKFIHYLVQGSHVSSV